MYETDEKFEQELVMLREKIAQEALAQEAAPSEEDTEQAKEKSDDELIAEAVRGMFPEGTSKEDIISGITDAMDTSCKRFRADTDIDRLLGEEKKIREVFPEFDIAEELKNDALFRRMIANGADVHSALLASNGEYQNRITQVIKRDAKREMADMLRRGRERIMPETGHESKEPEYDLSKLTDEEFEELEKKVKQSKRLFL